MISIIVPVYNAEEYLKNCVDSLCGQTYRDIEIILVDDGSKDSSPQICDQYAQVDGRVKVIHKKNNEGLGNARRTGVEYAKGDWICYVDADDWIEKETFTEISVLLSEEVDILVFGMCLWYEDVNGKVLWKESVVPEEKQKIKIEGIGNLILLLDLQRVFPYMCNKIYRTTFIRENNIEFNTIKSMEDFFYNIEIFKYAQCVVTVNKAFYNYRKPARETLVSSYNSNFFELSKKRYLSQIQFLRERESLNETTVMQLDYIFLKHVVSTLMKDAAPNANLSWKKRRDCAKIYLNDPLTQKILKGFVTKSRKWIIIVEILKNRKYTLACLIGKVGYIFQSKFKVFFHKNLKKNNMY